MLSINEFYNHVVINQASYTSGTTSAGLYYYGNSARIGYDDGGVTSTAKYIGDLNYKKMGRWTAMKVDDIRNRKTANFQIDLMAGAPNIYIPFIHAQHSGLSNDRAYYLHIYPDYYGFNNGKQCNWYGGVCMYDAYTGGKQHVEKVNKESRYYKFNFFDIINTIDASFMGNPRPYMTLISKTSRDVPTTTNTINLSTKNKAYPAEEMCGFLPSHDQGWEAIKKFAKLTNKYGSDIFK